MEKNSNKKFVRNTLMEMARMLSEYEPICDRHVIDDFGPLYWGNIEIGEDGLYSKDFMLTYYDGYFIISFSFTSDPRVIALVMQKLSSKFKLEVGDPFYYSRNDEELYYGDEGLEKHLNDLKKKFMNDKPVEGGTPHLMEKDNDLKN